MKKNIKTVISEVKKNGYSVLPNVYNKNFCKKTINKLESILDRLKKRRKYFGSNENQVIYNYFYHDIKLIKLTYNKFIDPVMSELIDEDYVLISPSARNPRILENINNGKKTSGFGWHVDSRVVKKNNSLIKPSLNFFAIIVLEDFTTQNASTKYVKKSHKLYKKPIDRNKNIQYEIMTAKAGSIIFFDAALWHRVGKPTKLSRWSIFNMYGPWYMKPYFRFTDGMNSKIIKKLNKFEKKILHFNSTPPVNSEGVLTTLKKI